MLGVEIETAVGIGGIQRGADNAANGFAGDLFLGGNAHLADSPVETKHRTAGDRNVVFLQLLHKGNSFILVNGDGFVNEHGHTAGNIGFGKFVVLVAVTGSDHHTIHLTDQLIAGSHHRHTVLFVQLLGCFRILTVNTHYLNIREVGVLGDDIQKTVGVGIFTT